MKSTTCWYLEYLRSITRGRRREQAVGYISHCPFIKLSRSTWYTWINDIVAQRIFPAKTDNSERRWIPQRYFDRDTRGINKKKIIKLTGIGISSKIFSRCLLIVNIVGCRCDETVVARWKKCCSFWYSISWFIYSHFFFCNMKGTRESAIFNKIGFAEGKQEFARVNLISDKINKMRYRSTNAI